MLISDKQELRRCVKQLVRRADVCEAALSFDVLRGELGVMPVMDCWTAPAATPGEALRRAAGEHTPFAQDAVATFAALDAMDLPTHDLDRAEAMQREYERNAYFKELLDTMRAKCVLVCVPLDQAEQVQYQDERLIPLLCVGRELFKPGRYGVDYAAAAQTIADAASCCGARNIRMDVFDAQMLRYCLLPVCEDQGFVLHAHLNCTEEILEFSEILSDFSGVRVLVSSEYACEKALISAAKGRLQMLVRLGGCDHLAYALSMLGTYLVPYAACASQPEIMLGRWIAAREEIWQALASCYLPLARTGFELQSAAIERDVRRMMSENLLMFCRAE